MSKRLIPRTEDDVMIVAAGGISPTGRNPQEAHAAAMEFRSGVRELTPADIYNFDLIAQVKGLKTDDERQEFFANVWGEKCGVGGVIPREYFPEPHSGFYPSSFHFREDQLVGNPVVQAYIAFAQVREKLPQLFSENEGRIRKDLAPETMIDVANGAGSAYEMVEREFLRFLLSENTSKLGEEYGRKKWLLGMLGNMSAAQLAAVAGVEGAQNSSNSACSSSGMAMFNAWNALRANSADIAIAGGSEYATGPVATYVSFDHMMKKRGGALTRKWRDDRNPDQALLAFGAARDGFVPGDAAGIIVLMRRRIMDELDIEPLARVTGVVANTCQSELYDKNLANGTITGQAALLERMLAKMGTDATRFRGRLVHFLHGTGTYVGGINEMYSAAAALGPIARDGRYTGTSVKERNGHSLGEATVENVIAAVQATQRSRVPGMPNTAEVDPAFREVDPAAIGKEQIAVDAEALRAIADGMLCRRHEEIDPSDTTFIATSMGFGGTNVAVALEKD